MPIGLQQETLEELCALQDFHRMCTGCASDFNMTSYSNCCRSLTEYCKMSAHASDHAPNLGLEPTCMSRHHWRCPRHRHHRPMAPRSHGPMVPSSRGLSGPCDHGIMMMEVGRWKWRGETPALGRLSTAQLVIQPWVPLQDVRHDTVVS